MLVRRVACSQLCLGVEIGHNYETMLNVYVVNVENNFLWFFSQMSSFSTTFSLWNERWNSHERFFFTKIRPYQVLTFIRTTLWAFTLTLWCIPFCIRKFVLAGFDRPWIRIYSQKIEMSMSKMADSKWRIEIYEIKWFCSLKTLTRGFWIADYENGVARLTFSFTRWPAVLKWRTEIYGENNIDL